MVEGLPRRQALVGGWLLLGGLGLVGGAIFATWLDSRLLLSGAPRAALWLGSLSGGLTLLAVGFLLERHLFRPLRTLHAQLARLLANPDASFTPPDGWLAGLAPELVHITSRLKDEHDRREQARQEGALDARRVRQALETLLQHLDTPIVVCDEHRRVLLFNPAAEAFFPAPSALGLGKRLDTLFTDPALITRFQALIDSDPTKAPLPREMLARLAERTLSVNLTRLCADPAEVLITLRDVTHTWQAQLETRTQIQQALEAKPETLALGSMMASLRLQSEQWRPIWSDTFWDVLDEQLDPAHKLIMPIGAPDGFTGHAPSLVALFDALIKRLHGEFPRGEFEGELKRDGERRWLALSWTGDAVDAATLQGWRAVRLESLPLAPSVEDVLDLHGSDLWSDADTSAGRARLCVSLPDLDPRQAPPARRPPRPEFHDFDIAYHLSPGTPLGERPIEQLEIVAFDTETTGLDLRGNDRIVSLGACRIVNARLQVDDTFEALVNPHRPIPAASTAIHGLRDEDVENAPSLPAVFAQFQAFIGEAILLAHNASFDLLALRPASVTLTHPVLDTLLISKALDKALDEHDLDALATRYDLECPLHDRHTALGDARLAARLWLALLPRLKTRNVSTLAQLLELQKSAYAKNDGSR
ncbi:MULTISPECIES: exonuclease domain-containing protein [unclassified Halomonas]|uniref:3'-5' exonuclease n=1 Tax=unclassified Halomonas TaxID=2609666 RepID=UPI00209E0134|nr:MULTISPECIES: exonuclease domain-containing protein [unclassified Halomonas]MCP1313378.1 exonuclease domain-containing protein [Halomonas sp. 707D7]MCP1325373.1 exonuclease domain-containing protein [Halomonas sp. 707D4]